MRETHWYERLWYWAVCFWRGHDPQPFNGPWQDCAYCGKNIRTVPKARSDEPGGEHWHKLEASSDGYDRCTICGLLVESIGSKVLALSSQEGK